MHLPPSASLHLHHQVLREAPEGSRVLDGEVVHAVRAYQLIAARRVRGDHLGFPALHRDHGHLGDIDLAEIVHVQVGRVELVHAADANDAALLGQDIIVAQFLGASHAVKGGMELVQLHVGLLFLVLVHLDHAGQGGVGAGQLLLMEPISASFSLRDSSKPAMALLSSESLLSSCAALRRMPAMSLRFSFSRESIIRRSATMPSSMVAPPSTSVLPLSSKPCFSRIKRRFSLTRLKAPNISLMVESFMEPSSANTVLSCSNCWYCSLAVGSSLQAARRTNMARLAFRSVLMLGDIGVDEPVAANLSANVHVSGERNAMRGKNVDRVRFRRIFVLPRHP